VRISLKLKHSQIRWTPWSVFQDGYISGSILYFAQTKWRRNQKYGYLSQFQVLFHSFSKVLFNFPSRYLFTIGLAKVFSLRWYLPPNSYCNLMQYYSKQSRRAKRKDNLRAYHPLWDQIPLDFSCLFPQH